jgi:hypothetical protein
VPVRWEEACEKGASQGIDSRAPAGRSGSGARPLRRQWSESRGLVPKLPVQRPSRLERDCMARIATIPEARMNLPNGQAMLRTHAHGYEKL